MLILIKHKNEGPNFKVGDNVRISKYKSIFDKRQVPIWSEETFVIKKIRIISDLKVEKNFGTFYGKELQKTNEKEFRVEKVIKRKGDKLYVKWRDYANLKSINK